MTYKVDDWVVHPQHGVGRVVKLATCQFGSRPSQLYYEISIPDGTFWVQVEGSSCGLRKVTAKEELPKFRDLLRSHPAPLNEEHRQRQIEISERLSQGTFQAKCEVVRDLSALGWHKPLGEGNARILRNAQQAVYEEWAIALGISISKALHEVDSLLHEGRQIFNDG